MLQSTDSEKLSTSEDSWSDSWITLRSKNQIEFVGELGQVSMGTGGIR